MPGYKDFISIGKIQKTVGISGYLNIKFLTDFPLRFLNLRQVRIFNEEKKIFIKNEITGNENFIIEDFKFINDYGRILFRFYGSIDNAKKLINSLILVSEKDKLNLEENSFYFFDLIGCEIKNNNKLIGRVISVENYGGDDLLNIKIYDNEKEFLLHMVKSFIKKIDIRNKIIEVELIEGFID